MLPEKMIELGRLFMHPHSEVQLGHCQLILIRKQDAFGYLLIVIIHMVHSEIFSLSKCSSPGYCHTFCFHILIKLLRDILEIWDRTHGVLQKHTSFIRLVREMFCQIPNRISHTMTGRFSAKYDLIGLFKMLNQVGIQIGSGIIRIGDISLNT
jgi:hypothetical protein